MMLQSLQDAGKAAIHLTLNYKPIGLVSARITDMMDDFIAIDTGCITLSRNSELDIHFNTADRNRHHFRARVVGSLSNHTLLQIWDNGGKRFKNLKGLTTHP